jgi:hypothetical protein
MKIDGPRGRLYDAQQTIRAKWNETCEHWSDATRGDFEEHVWIPMDQLTSDGLRAIDRLSQLLGQVRRECQGDA